MRKIKSIFFFRNLTRYAETNIKTPPKKILWGVAPTGDIHIGYLPFAGILSTLSSYGTEQLVLVANYHAYLDSEKTSWNKISERTSVYIKTLKAMNFKNIIESSNVYTKKEYFEGLLKFSRFLPSAEILDWAERTLKSAANQNYTLADLLYVATQIYDMIYFDTDSVICGEDESGIYRFSLPILSGNLKHKCNYIYLPACPGVVEKEMHASDSDDNKILVIDNYQILKGKLVTAKMRNPNLYIYLYSVLFPVYGLENEDILRVLSRDQLLIDDNIIEDTTTRLLKITRPIRLKFGIR